MKNGDISNHSAPIIVFDLDSLLFKDEKINTGIVNKFAKVISGDPMYDYFNREINRNFVFICNSIWLNYGYSILLETSFPYFDNPSLYDFLNERIILYYSNLVDFKDMDDLRLRVDLEFQLYVSNSEHKLAQIGKSNAIHITDLHNYILHFGRKK